jgi:hypothetical protein
MPEKNYSYLKIDAIKLLYYFFLVLAIVQGANLALSFFELNITFTQIIILLIYILITRYFSKLKQGLIK